MPEFRISWSYTRNDHTHATPKTAKPSQYSDVRGVDLVSTLEVADNAPNIPISVPLV